MAELLSPDTAARSRSPPAQPTQLNIPETFSRSTAISVAIDPVALITTECITVTSAMRKHARWSHSSVSAILGGATAGYGRETSRPSTPRGSIGSRREGKSGDSPLLGTPGDDEIGLANRWGLRGKKGKSIQDNPLMSAFAKLRADLAGCKDIRNFDTPALLHPFLQVIRSSSTSAPITSLALVAITKFFSYNIISRTSRRLPLAMQLLSSAITHCRFEASDSAADEVVLLRILNLMEIMIAGPGGDTLGDESVCEMMETGLSMCCQIRLSELLRRSAEMSMITMCQVIFERLKYLEREAGDEVQALDEDTKEDMDTVKMVPSVDGDNVTSFSQKAREEPSSDGLETPDSRGEGSVNGSAIDVTQAAGEGEVEVKPYSLPSIRELFRVLVDLLDPRDRQHTDTMRVMALRVIDVALEVAGPSIARHPSLTTLAKDDLCRYLFQLVRSDNMAILNESLRVAGTLLATCRGALKLQQELFLSYLVACLHPRVDIPREPGIDPKLYEGVPQAPKLVKPPPSQSSSGRSTPVPIKDRQKLGLEGGTRKPDAREAMVECLCALARIPSFMVELFLNYDSDVDRSDLCEDIVGLLARNAFPDSATWSTTNVPPLCLDALLGYVQFIADRLGHEPRVDGYPDRTKLREQREVKRIISRGATKFNENPTAGIVFLASQGIINDADNPASIATFLKGTSRVSKKVLGEYLSKRSHEHILGAFLDLFNFAGKRVDEALRELLNSFRLPGESPLIERIVTVFSEKYCANSPPEGIADKDAVYILTYAIIMLNTDQHNPNVKSQNRMSYTDFARNLRGVNGGKDFEPNYLQEIYNSIRDNEIILPDEHDNKHAFDYAWKELLLKTDASGEMVLCDSNIYDADMFASTWKPVVATLSYVFMSASDDTVFSRVVTGFDQCARIAGKYGLTEALDQIIYCLSTISTLATESRPSTVLNTEVQAGEKSVMVSELAVKFGRDFKAQLATVVLFRVVLGNEGVVRNGWAYISRIWLNLFVNSLIPSSLLSSDQVLDVTSIPLQNPLQIIDRGERSAEMGIFSAFTSYLSSYAADEPPEPSDEELESTLCTVDCITACSIETIFANIRSLGPVPLKSLVQALFSQLPEQSSPAVISVKPDMPAPSPVKLNGQRRRPRDNTYDPGVVFILELVTVLTLRDKETIADLGAQVAEVLHSVVRDAPNAHPVVVSRSIYYLLNLLRASDEHSFVRTPVILHSISSLGGDNLEQSALPILKGIKQCLQGPPALRNEMSNSPDFWSILHMLHSIQDAAAGVFDIIEEVTVGEPSAITADNYESAVSLLNDFANAASVGAALEQRRDREPRQAKNAKQGKPKPIPAVSRGVKAISLVHAVSDRAPSLITQSHLDRSNAWKAYWSPIFRSVTIQCVNPCREVRHQAFSILQPALLSPQITSTSQIEWVAIFTEVLFPLIGRLLKPEIYQSDPHGMGETRVQAATLLCRVFLHYLERLAQWEGMLDLWLKILDLMDRLMNSGQGDNLEEAVPESLKNILLVMSTDGLLVPPTQNPDRENFWVQTWARLERFMPNLFAELFPEEAQKPQSTTKKDDSSIQTPPASSPKPKTPDVVPSPKEEPIPDDGDDIVPNTDLTVI
ncbi:Sec7-domain-containing protein [Xylona heveae TC161]|uniref:Sec7-domain-containing protein n=1 Tax=Xylona heveae (strain CBS 132557 / TC161) TaxID=1328760 RepID=A0A165HBY9_XYLHT|nr:Sec7-domain-containing protein [Xylona heveae TC161]KZF23276.1 Sec7-domain-containing protein [Xylona heveae TC161]